MGIVKENKVIVPESIKKILNDLNFSGIRALAKVNESSVMIEEYIRDVLSDPDVLEIMNKEEKLQIFGSIFSRCPSKFKLSPGHKVTFQILSEVCKEIVQRLNFPPFSHRWVACTFFHLLMNGGWGGKNLRLKKLY
jgi:hypothetical protein